VGAAPVFAQYLKDNKNPKYTVSETNTYPTGTSSTGRYHARVRLGVGLSLERCALATNRLWRSSEYHRLCVFGSVGHSGWLEMGLLLHHGMWIRALGSLHGVSLLLPITHSLQDMEIQQC
jgi:hypothetical protein